MATTLSKNINNYCVYFHIRKDTNTVFYIGKGWNTRPCSTRNRNPHWHNIVNKAGKEHKIVARNLTNDQACKLEIRLIALYRSRRPNTTVNITSGGDGIPGYKHTPESRAKMSKAKKGRPHTPAPGVGILISKAKLGKPTKLSKSVLCNETGEIFVSCSAAAREHNVHVGALHKHLFKKPYHLTCKGRTYQWL